MRYEYRLSAQAYPELIAFLDTNGIRYKLIGNEEIPYTVYFSVWSSSLSEKPAIICELENSYHYRIFVTVSAEYSKSDLEHARYLEIRSRWQKIEIVNIQEAFTYSCFVPNVFGVPKPKHEEQTGLLTIAKEPATMKTQTAFWCSETAGYTEIFADRRVYDLVKANELSGVQFDPVILKNREYSKNLYQMTTQHIIDCSCIAMGYGEKKVVCPICGKEQFVVDNTYQLHLDFSRVEPQSDLYVTERIFGDGLGDPRYIISQKFYRLLKQNKLTGGLVLTPVIDVS